MSTFDNSTQDHPLQVKNTDTKSSVGVGGQVTKVLLVDDDIDLGSFINTALSTLGYEVHFQNSLVGINGIIKDFFPNVIVLDVEIGKQNGIDEAEKILQCFPTIPIIFISSHTEIEHVSRGLSSGGVCYLKKPFDIQELDAYIRRFSQKNTPENVILIGLYSLELCDQKLVFKEEIVKHLSPMEKNGLLLLINNKNNVVSREQFSQELWGTEFSSDIEGALNNLMFKLRKMINKDARLSIETVKFKGYKLKFKG